MRSLAARLNRLEQIEALATYVGEKHVVELNRRSSTRSPGSFEADFEERPGPGPRLRVEQNEMHIYFVGSPEPQESAELV